MISPHSSFKGVITEITILEAAERYNYQGYIPYNFIKDLVAAWTHMIYNNIPDIIVQNEYDKTFKKLLNLFNVEYIPYVSVMEWVMNILKECSNKINFRNLEEASKNNTEFSLEEEKVQLNYKIDLHNIPSEVLELFDVDIEEDSNTIELEEDIKTILKFYEALQSLNKFLNKEPILVRNQMKDYNQIMKIRKSRIIYPTFAYDLLKKNLSVKFPKMIPSENSETILLIDNSSSTHEYPKYKELYKAILIYFYSKFQDNNKLTIYYFDYEIQNTIIIETKEELKKLIFKSLPAYITSAGWTESENYFEKILSNKDIILLTDGVECNTLNFWHVMRNNTWYIIALNHNDNLRNLASNTNGKFIEV